jgi:hypothetical protein
MMNECNLNVPYINNAECLPIEFFVRHPPQVRAILWSHNRKVPASPFRSKKKVRWVIQHDSKTHEIICSISFYSGRKRA